MNTIFKLNFYLVLGFVCLLSSCDYSDSFVEKVKSLTSNEQEYIDDEMQEKYVVNEEHLDSISQNLKLLEHRVYYVDCSGSMISKNFGNKYENGRTLLDDVKDSLEMSLLNLSIDSADIDIIPFYGRKWNNGNLHTSTIHKRGVFTSADRDYIHNIISSINVPENSNSWNTHHSIPINDFLNNRISNKKQYHIMILLTDGKDEYNMSGDHEQSGTDALRNNWSQSYKQNKIYGIYDNLPKNVISGDLPDFFRNNGSSKLFWIQGVNFNINIFQLSNTTDEVMLRKDSLIRIPFGGKMPKVINLTTKEDKHYRYELIQPNPNDKYLKIKVSAIHDGKLPDSWPSMLRFVYDWGEHKTNTYNFPDEEVVSVTIVDEKTPKLELCEADCNYRKGSLIKREISYYKKWHNIGKEYSDTAIISLAYSYSKDVTDDPSIKQGGIRIEGVPEYVCILDSCDNNIKNQEILFSKTQNGRLTLKITLSPGNSLLEDDRVDSLKVRFIGVDNYNTIKWNGKRIDKTTGSYCISAILLNAHEENNPLLTFIFTIIGLLILIIVLFFLFLKLRAFLSPKFHADYHLEFRTNDNFDIVNERNFELKGDLTTSDLVFDSIIYTNKLHHKFIKEVIVACENFNKPYQTWLDKMYNGEIIVITCNFHNQNIDKIIFIPSHNNLVLCRINNSENEYRLQIIDSVVDSNHITIDNTHIYTCFRQEVKTDEINNNHIKL